MVEFTGCKSIWCDQLASSNYGLKKVIEEFVISFMNPVLIYIGLKKRSKPRVVLDWQFPMEFIMEAIDCLLSGH